MTQQAVNQQLQPIFLKLPPENIVRLKSLIESYEALAEMRTLNPQTGEIVLLALGDTAATLQQLVASVAEELHIREIPQPDVAETNDWLLKEI